MTEERRQHDKDIEKVLTAFNEHSDKDELRFDANDKQMAGMETKIDLILKALYGDKEKGEIGIKEIVEPLVNMKGFWKIMGVLAGVIALFASAIAGILYLINIIKIK